MLRLLGTATLATTTRAYHRCRLVPLPGAVAISANNPPRWFSSSSDQKNDNGNEMSSTSEDDEAEWIPPNRPLSGDQGHSKLYRQAEQLQETEHALEEALFTIDEENDSQEKILRQLEEALALEEQQLEQQQKLAIEEVEKGEETKQVDWMQTRRTALGEQPISHPAAPSVIPVIHHTLLTESELVQLLKLLGAEQDSVAVLLDNLEQPRMGGSKGMIVCTASNPFHIRTMTKSLIDHLKERKLQELGVLGAQMGSQSLNNSPSNNWNVVDCQNYMVHILDQPTRTALKLEELWSGKDPLWKLNIGNDDDVEAYVAKNPVPEGYGPNPEQLWDIGKLQRSQFITHRPVVPSHVKSQDSKDGKRRRREQRFEQRRSF